MEGANLSDNRHIETWKVKRLIKKLDACKGNNTSFVSLCIPPKTQLNVINQRLTEELSAAGGIKSKQTRTSVQSAITSTKEKLKLYKRTPDNGLIIYCGIIMQDDGKSEKKVTYDIEPFKPAQSFLYSCESAFDTSPLMDLLGDDDRFGFIIVDGSGALYGELQGSVRTILQKITVQLPKKHGRGGQSANRFARLREEKRHNYVRKVAELATQNFIKDDKPTVKGLVLAGSANFKTVISESDLFDKRLQEIIVSIVDVSYGGENGFNQAITQSSEALGNVKFVQEKKLVTKFLQEISQDTGMIVFGVDESIQALEAGALETVMLYEDIEVMRYEIKNPFKDEVKVHYLNKAQQKDPKYFKDAETGSDLEVIKTELLSEWLCFNYEKFGARLEFITDKSQEGYQFCNGFGGIGGFLRYKLNMDEIMKGTGNDDDFDPDEDFI